MIRNLFLAALFVSTIAAANYATTEFGLISAGFGLMVLTGTYMAGLALGLRDALQESAPFRRGSRRPSTTSRLGWTRQAGLFDSSDGAA